MAGVRRNVAKVSQAERDKLRDAILALDGMNHPDGVSFWDKQDGIHQATHVHGGPAFVPWHRELCNRFEALLQQVDPAVALHYWDWTTDPRHSPDGSGGFADLFTPSFMGSASGRAGVPLDTLDNNGVFAGSRADTGNPADPPQEITRGVAPGAPGLPADATIIGAGDALPQAEQWQAFRMALEGAHNSAHGYIGGTIGAGHSAFEDPFVFLLHSNVDRLWASWQRAPGQAWRLDPGQVYGNESADPAILEHMEPWAGVSGLRPWAPPENEELAKDSRDPSVVAPPEYEDYARRPIEPPRTACHESCLSVTVRDSQHPCRPYQSSAHSFAVEIFHCDGHPLFWNGISFGAGVPLQVAGAAGGAIHGQLRGAAGLLSRSRRRAMSERSDRLGLGHRHVRRDRLRRPRSSDGPALHRARRHRHHARHRRTRTTRAGARTTRGEDGRQRAQAARREASRGPTAGAAHGTTEVTQMGVNLVTRVRNFSIQNRTFAASDHDVQDGCVTPGSHKLLRFDFLSYNAGNADLVIGSPAARPDLFVWSAGHGHYHLKDFNEFLLFNSAGALATTGFKQAFCAIDIDRISPTASPSARFNDCNSDQGISAGWADVYSSFLACQFIVLDGVADGDYTLQSTTNAQHRVGEDCLGDNAIWTGLRLSGNTVQLIDPPFIPEDCIPFNRSSVAAVQAGGRWKVAEGNHWMLDTGTSQGEAERAVEIINHYDLASMCFVGRPRCGDVRPMMYWLTDAGRAPSGQLAGEDCIPFDRNNLAVVEIGGRWKVVEGTHWILDFGPGEGNARAALHFIRKYRFDQICFVGRPDPSMTYFKTRGRRPVHIHPIDQRVIEAAIDPPRWWQQQVELVAEQAPWIDLGAECLGQGPNRREFRGFVIEVAGRDASQIVTSHGITGLETNETTEIRLAAPAGVVDVGVTHFGSPPSVAAYAGDKRVAEAVADERPRHIENLRLVGKKIDRVTLTSPDAAAILNYVRSQPEAPRKASKKR